MPINTPLVPVVDSPIIQAARSINNFENAWIGRDQNSVGVFGSTPFCTPKFARHNGAWSRNLDYTNTMARMFIPVDKHGYEKFRKSLKDPITQNIATVLTGDDEKVGGHGYIDFLLHTARHEFEDKVQIIETLGDNYVAYFFGHSAPIFQYQGTLMNTYQDDWTMNMFRIFRDLGRGTQLARHGLNLYIRYDSMILSGAMMNFNWSLIGGAETYCPFGFSFLVKSIKIIYGGLKEFPTKFENIDSADDKFAPSGFELSTSSPSSQNARRLYTGTFAQSEEDILAEQTEVYLEHADLPKTDPSGTPAPVDAWGASPTTEDPGKAKDSEGATPPKDAPKDEAWPPVVIG